MDLKIRDRVIVAPIGDILGLLQKATGKPREFRCRGDNYQVTCPFHKNGEESHPSCQVYCGSGDVEYGFMHCFTCGENGPLWHFVGECLGRGDEHGKKWLLDNFGNCFTEKTYDLPPLEAEGLKALDESCLEGLLPWHPYMGKRRLSRKACEAFQVGYDPKDDCLVFPVRDEYGRLAMLTRRSVSGKKFMVDADAEKPVYAMDRIRKEGLTEATVVESQINCLTLWGWGIPSVALFGTGTKSQYGIINRSGLRTLFLALDGDSAGAKGTRRLLSALSPSILAYVVELPRGKDVNDLTYEEFNSLPVVEAHDGKGWGT